MVQMRERVSDLMWRREANVGFWRLGLLEEGEINMGSVRLEMRATRANKIMMNVAWRMEWGDGGRGEVVGNVRVWVSFLDIGVYSISSKWSQFRYFVGPRKLSELTKTTKVSNLISIVIKFRVEIIVTYDVI